MLKELVDQYYSDRKKDKDKFHFYITDAGKCPRSVFFKFKKAPEKEKDPRILRIFEHGNSIHQLVMRAFFGSNDICVIASEIGTPPQELISGRADAIISVNDELYVVDIKSMNSMIFRKMTSPKVENLYQIQLYLHYFGIKKGVLFYMDKDRQEIKEFIVDYNEKLCHDLLNGFKVLKEKIDQNIIPPVLADYPKNWQCRYCDFKKICSLAGRNELRWSDLKKKIEGYE